jgi:hypothetical protein
MVVEIRRYLGNTLSAHIHDADHEHPNCHLGRISSENRLWYDPLEEARSDMGYEDCSWCMEGSDDRRSVGAATSITLEL